VLVLSDGLRINGTELLNGVKDVLPSAVVVSGRSAQSAAAPLIPLVLFA
jgi:hypothetical protein